MVSLFATEFVHEERLNVCFGSIFDSDCVSTCSTPQNIRELCLFILLTFMYTTRVSSCADNRFVQKSRLQMKLKSFPAFGTRLWNCLHPDWRKLTKRAFKRKIHKLLLTVLKIEDYYVDAHSLISNLNKRIELNEINIV